MPGHRITCPYCFTEFDDSQVMFRMETVFDSEDDLSITDPGTGKKYYSRDEIMKDPTLNESTRKGLFDQFGFYTGFVKQEDQEYEDFWKRFNGTTEVSAKAHDGGAQVDPWLRRVYDPHNPAHQKFFKFINPPSDTGLIWKATDCFGRETTRRVCPVCHNPLPGLYGKYPVKFISIIGITGAGKTVYLSQLVQWLVEDFSRCGITAEPTSTYAYRYRNDNPVEMQKPLPPGTEPQTLLQPLCFDLIYKDDSGRSHGQTLVFYDIAGENCQISYDDAQVAAKAKQFGPFIEHSNGIMLVVQPQQFEKPDPVGGPQAVLTVVHDLFAGHANDLEKIPLAVCISKGDTVAQAILGGPIPQNQYVKNNLGRYCPVFNAESYNKIYSPVFEFVQRMANALVGSLSSQFPIHDLFIVSAIGTAVEEFTDDNGNTYEAPAAPPSPQRLVEPLLWMLNRFGYIGATGFINEPNDWECPKCGRRLHTTDTFCPDCGVNRNGNWICPLCGNMNAASDVQCTHTERGFLGMTKRCRGVPSWQRQQ
ncbi:hypothetical protein COO72_06345 [Bifidobacterium callitrichos]|nr:hypothetical protein COO72_06345 [Bifidobacterium callitrichos]